MRKWWYRLKNRWTQRDHWQHQYPYQYSHRERQKDYGLFKKTLVAALLFSMVYGLHISNTVVGRAVGDAIRYVLNAETDISFIADWLTANAPPNIDMSVLKKVRTTISKPADPLMYMGKPVEGTVVSSYGWQAHPVSKQQILYEGIDIEAPLGTAVRAAAQGVVKTISDTTQHGRILIIEHGNEVETIYGCLGEIIVKPGDSVSQGQVIARVGKITPVATPVLYFEIRVNGKAIDPLTRIKGEYSLKERK